MTKLSSPSFPQEQVLWQKIQVMAQERLAAARLEAVIRTVVLDSTSLAQGLSRTLSRQSADPLVPSTQLEALFFSLYQEEVDLVAGAVADLVAFTERDPAATDVLTAFLYIKGFHALQTHRAAHHLWKAGHKDDAFYLQNRSSVLYGVDIHPAARIGKGIMFDHATGVVVGETAVIADNVSLLHQVTLGGTGKEPGDRHPKIAEGVMIGAGATILGNVKIGTGACIAAGSVVLQDVPAHTTVAGIPAKIVGRPRSEEPAREMNQTEIFGDAPL